MLIVDAVVKQAAAQVAAQIAASRNGWAALHTVACLANADLPEEEDELAAAVRARGCASSTFRLWSARPCSAWTTCTRRPPRNPACAPPTKRGGREEASSSPQRRTPAQSR